MSVLTEDNDLCSLRYDLVSPLADKLLVNG